MDAVSCLLLLLRAKVLGNPDVDAIAKADEKACEQGDKRCGGADGAECCCAGKFADDGNVCHVEKNLQQLRKNERHTEQQNVFPQGAIGHGNGTRMAL